MWTERDRAILITLTRKVRFLSFEQILRTWWQRTESGVRNARRRLALLEAEGYLSRLTVHAHPELELTEPVCVWHPGEPAPNFGAVSYRLKSRWTKPLKPTALYLATKKACRHFGGVESGGYLKRPLQATHDLHVGTLYLALLRSGAAERWVSEDQLRTFPGGGKLPDAALADSQGEVRCFIEFGGSYEQAQVEAKHHAWARLARSYDISYEIW